MNFKTRLRILLVMLVLLLSGWFVGYLYFIFYYPEETCSSHQADAVVVLTGEKNRIEEAIKLYSITSAKNILISGVGVGVIQKDFAKIAKLYNVPEEHLVLGSLAENTLGNAIEAKIFMNLRGYHSLCLVTSNYHLPRSMKIFQDIMPEIKIGYYPVHLRLHEEKGWSAKLSLLKKIFIEYNKYLIYHLMHSWDIIEIGYYDFLYNTLYEFIPKLSRQK